MSINPTSVFRILSSILQFNPRNRSISGRSVRDVDDMQEQIGQVQHGTDSLGHRQDVLSDRIDKLSLLVLALWTLLKDKTGLSDEQLIEKVKELDLADGSLDGKIGESTFRCPKCGAAVSTRLNRCQFCGHEAEPPAKASDLIP